MDKQGRIIIPCTLVDLVGLSVDTQIAVCRLKDLTFYIRTLDKLTDEDKVLEIRKIDSKGRIYLSKSVLKDFNIDLAARPIIYAQGEIIYFSFE